MPTAHSGKSDPASLWCAASHARRTSHASVFRAFLSTWAARAFFVVLVAAFALWGIADVVRNVGHDTALATVGDRKIEPPEFQEAFRRDLAQVTRMMGAARSPRRRCARRWPSRRSSAW